MTKPLRSWLSSMLAASILFSVAACDSDSSDDENHPEADRVHVESGPITVVNASEATAFAPILVCLDCAVDLNIVFVDADDVPLSHGSDEYLDFQIADGSLARWDEDAAGSFTGTLRGLQLGSTTVRLRLMHGAVGDSDSHADFTSAAITLNVVERVDVN